MLLSSEEIRNCKRKIDVRNQITFGVMISYFKTYIKFPANKNNTISSKLISQVIDDLEINESSAVDFKWEGRTVERYRSEIRLLLGYREATNNDSKHFIKYLLKDILPRHPSKGLLMEQVKVYFNQNKIEIFKDSQLHRYINSAKYQFEQEFLKSIYENLNTDNRYLIDQVLTEIIEDSEEGIIELSELKKDIPGARLKNVSYAIDRINLLSKIKVPASVFSNVDRKLLLEYYDRVMALSPSNILEFNTITKYAVMAIFFHIKRQLMLDLLADTFIKLVNRMRTKAKKYVDNNVLKEIKRVEGKLDILERLAIASVDNPKNTIEEKIYPEVSKEKLLEVIADLKRRGKWYQKQIQEKIHSNYVHGSRKVLLAILKVLPLKEDHADYKPILEAVSFINKYCNESDADSYEATAPLDNIIIPTWEPMVVTKKGDKKIVNKYNYEIAVLEQLTSFLTYKAVWIEDSYRYRDPNEDLPKDFQQNKKAYYEMLGLPICAKEFIKQLKELLRCRLESLNSSIVDNKLVKIQASSTGKNISVTPSEAQKEPENIDMLQKEIIEKWSSINLIDILKECDLLINFTEQMETIARSSNINKNDLRKRLLLCLYGIGSNTGLKRISIANGDVNYSNLTYVKKRFINKTNVRTAIRLVVNNVLEIRDKEIWGEATTTVACDSTQVSAWDQNLINEWHHRYKGRGVMIYWHVDKKALCIYSQLKSCSSSEVGSMIKGLIGHDTKMNIDRVFTDTHGQSELGFAASYLLDFSLLPRFKAINKQKVYAVSTNDKQKYNNISQIIKGTINWKIIEENYDEVVQYIVALKLGLIEPSVLVKRFSEKNYNHPVYKALIEIGRANKSIFLCEYLEKEELRIEINEGLNVVERMNNVMDFIFYGKLGEMKTNKTEDQELSVLCLHLLQACMVYINTLIIQQVLYAEHWKNKLTAEDYRALTPLLSMHINPYGLFPIDFNQRISISPIVAENL